jgi:hypothetical protein
VVRVLSGEQASLVDQGLVDWRSRGRSQKIREIRLLGGLDEGTAVKPQELSGLAHAQRTHGEHHAGDAQELVRQHKAEFDSATRDGRPDVAHQ